MPDHPRGDWSYRLTIKLATRSGGVPFIKSSERFYFTSGAYLHPTSVFVGVIVTMAAVDGQL
jgi:hypothetical protein